MVEYMKNNRMYVVIILLSLLVTGCDAINSGNDSYQEKLIDRSHDEEKVPVVEELNFYDLIDMDEERSHVLMHDIDEGNILLSSYVDRRDAKLQGGISAVTKHLYLYNPSENNLDIILELDNFYVLSALMVNDKYMVLGINLDRKNDDSTFSILYGKKNDMNKIYEGYNASFFTRFPRIFKVGSEIVFIEPQIKYNEKPQNVNDDLISEVKVYKWGSDKFEEIEYNLPDYFSVLETSAAVSNNDFVTFWEDKKEEQAKFLIMNLNEIKRIFPLPKNYRLLDFTSTDKYLYISVEALEPYDIKLLIFDKENEKLYSTSFDRLIKMTNMFEGDKIYAEGSLALYHIEFKNEKLHYSKIKFPEKYNKFVRGVSNISKFEEDILFNYFSDKKMLKVRFEN